VEKYLFVYGTLKRGFWNSALLKRAKPVGEGKTRERFKLYTVGYPYAVPDSKGLPLKGEVYIVDSKTLKEVDNLEGYPYHYKRKSVEVELSDGRVVKALLYYAENPRGEPLPPKGKVYEWEGE